MQVRHLSVADFRSWKSADLTFDPGTSVLVGPNGQGKTNLVEALGYVATLASHRVASDAPLVRAGADRAIVRSAIVADARELRVELEIVAGKANRAKLNGAPLPRTREVLGALRTVLFAPEDLAIVRGDPTERRRFLDELVVTRTPRMAVVRSDYDRVLKQRAALLKSAGAARRGGGADLRTLDVWDGHLAAHGAQLLRARLETIRALRPWAVAAYAQVAPTSAPLGIRYVSSLAEQLPGLGEPGSPAGRDGSGAADGSGAPACGPPDGDELPHPVVPDPVVPDPVVLEAALGAALARARPAELERGVNLVGPHRDDVELTLGDLPVRGYASHGEGWSVALSLRLGSFELLRTESSSAGDPVLILDDVFAELDRERREQLAVTAAGAEQVLVTAAVAGDVPDLLQGARYDVFDGSVRRVR